jgi:hypothetical protein
MAPGTVAFLHGLLFDPDDVGDVPSKRVTSDGSLFHLLWLRSGFSPQVLGFKPRGGHVRCGGRSGNSAGSFHASSAFP